MHPHEISYTLTFYAYLPFVFSFARNGFAGEEEVRLAVRRCQNVLADAIWVPELTATFDGSRPESITESESVLVEGPTAGCQVL